MNYVGEQHELPQGQVRTTVPTNSPVPWSYLLTKPTDVFETRRKLMYKVAEVSSKIRVRLRNVQHRSTNRTNLFNIQCWRQESHSGTKRIVKTITLKL